MRLIFEVVFLSPMVIFVAIGVSMFVITAVVEWLDDAPGDVDSIEEFRHMRRVLAERDTDA